jgi:hypothetical protein
MLALLVGHNWHWVGTTAHVLYNIWPYAARVMALTKQVDFWRFLDFSDFLTRELVQKTTRIETLERVLAQERAILNEYRQGREIQRAWDTACAWQQRYELQVRVCRTTHLDRPLPTMPMDAAQAQQIEEALPF